MKPNASCYRHGTACGAQQSDVEMFAKEMAVEPAGIGDGGVVLVNRTAVIGDVCYGRPAKLTCSLPSAIELTKLDVTVQRVALIFHSPSILRYSSW
jgi:hypothetical protein